MKKIFHLLFFLPVLSFAQGTLFFSEYIEGSSNNKALEIYNGTDSTVDLRKDEYVIQFYFNGNINSAVVLAPKAVLVPGEVFVLLQNSYNLALPPSGLYAKDSTNAGWYNGDDAVALRRGGATGQVIDVIGQIGLDPGVSWVSGTVSTQDRTLLRKPSVTKGDINGLNAFDPSIEWTSLPIDNVNNLGSHLSSFSFTPGKLSFLSRGIGIVSDTSNYVIQIIPTLDSLHIRSTSIDFQIAYTLVGPYQDSLVFFPSDAVAGVVVYVRYLPTSPSPHSASLVHRLGNDSVWFPLTGQIIQVISKKIGEVQGDSSVSQLISQKVSITGVVTLDAQKAEEQNGFFLQDSSDGNPLTSDGLFVYDPSLLLDVQIGQTLRVEGEVAEAFGQTELKNVLTIEKISDTPLFPLDTAIISFPFTSNADLEKTEGMLVKIPQKMVVTENYNLGRYGEITISLNDRLYNPSERIDLNDEDPNGTKTTGTANLAAVLAQQDLNNRSQIILSDLISTQNPNPIPFVDTLTKTIRNGSSISHLRGVMSYGFESYLIYSNGNTKFEYAPRPQVPVLTGSNVIIAGMNVLNFFNGDGQGGGFPTSRGALTTREFRRQKAKIVASLLNMAPDVAGLMEIENDASTSFPALIELVDTLNTALTSKAYSYIPEPSSTNGNSGTDEIKVALIYRASTMTPVGPAIYWNDPAFTNLGRPPLAQTFRHNTSGEQFIIIVNHFKSKGCTGATGDNLDQLDGQGCFNSTRKLQAEALSQFITQLTNSTGETDIITIGDFNSYGQEDPLDVLRENGLINLTENTYSYAFFKQFGSLDHAFVSASMNSKTEKAEKWHINSDEPPVIDYTLSFKTQDLYQDNAYRSSDHDPVMVGFHFEPIATSFDAPTGRSTIKVHPNPISHGRLHFSVSASGTLMDTFGKVLYSFYDQNEIDTSTLAKGVYYLNFVGFESEKVIVQ